MCAASLLPGVAGAQYPERTINVIVAYSPGGGTDLIAREQGYDIELSSLRYLAPAQYEGLVREADGTYRALWKELPWADK